MNSTRVSAPTPRSEAMSSCAAVWSRIWAPSPPTSGNARWKLGPSCPWRNPSRGRRRWAWRRAKSQHGKPWQKRTTKENWGLRKTCPKWSIKSQYGCCLPNFSLPIIAYCSPIIYYIEYYHLPSGNPVIKQSDWTFTWEDYLHVGTFPLPRLIAGGYISNTWVI